jgi:hypothetical protein
LKTQEKNKIMDSPGKKSITSQSSTSSKISAKLASNPTDLQIKNTLSKNRNQSKNKTLVRKSSTISGNLPIILNRNELVITAETLRKSSISSNHSQSQSSQNSDMNKKLKVNLKEHEVKGIEC